MEKDKKNAAFFGDKKLRYGAFSTLICVFVIAAVIGLNIVVSLFDIRYDLTTDKRYSISKETRDIIAGLDEDVTIYALVRGGGGDIQYDELLNQYDNASRRISVEYKDPYLNPTFVETYRTDGEEIPEYSVIVAGQERYRVLPADDLFTTEFDWSTGRQVFKSFDLEPMVTNAIRYIINKSSVNVYQVTNHDEDILADSIKKQLAMQNFAYYELDLFNAEQIPEDTGVLIMSTPVRDYTKEEAEKVLDYLYNGGNAIMFADGIFGEKPNYTSIIEAYCLDLNDYLVLEGNPSYSLGGMPHYLLPDFTGHTITDNLPSNTYAMMIYASALSPAAAIRNTVTIEPLMNTSRSSYGKTGEMESVNPEPGDVQGPFCVAAAVTDARYIPDAVTTRLVVAASSSMLSEELNATVAGGNGDFILNAALWMSDADETVYIRPKTNIGLDSLIINDTHRRILQACSMFVLPGIIIAAGVAVWAKRRNR